MSTPTTSPDTNPATNGKPETDDDALQQEQEQTKFSPEEEAELLAVSNSHKAEANALFSKAKYDAAITKYDEAVAACPNYLDYELAVLRSNMAACHIKLEEWKEAISQATAALDGLDRLEAAIAEEEKRKEEEKEAERKRKEEEEEGVEEEIISPGARNAATPPPQEEEDEEDEEAEAARRKRAEDILRIRAKALLRRARARSELGGWSNLAGAEEDYRALAAIGNLGPADRRVVETQLRELPARVKTAQEKEMGEMWGKLKDLGNGILKPFGLSTENFQMVKDENTGGYSMNFKPKEG